jgi:hypothetical protein
MNRDDQDEDSTQGWDVIYSYSRAQALSDGVLVDVSKMAREAGIRFPVAVTSAVWGNYVAVPPGVECQDEAGRLWDILFMFAMRVRSNNRAKPGDNADTITFALLVRNNNERPSRVDLKAVCGPGDDAEPVITIMLPEED